MFGIHQIFNKMGAMFVEYMIYKCLSNFIWSTSIGGLSLDNLFPHL